ncbi:hypothetical protein AMAG_00459 [Allomyces macrogynus ATCC 38327]|uniref:Uncharacterized protein n=1 Tax=Allomyces macrogynus (strain ATCC 38327) TaxID=578462 RepID=A0A0L0RWL6_ALLM3|nr:hypothetical protein AMAG_00459 [Allomyces macrogynus ATCC 38327]|eukprot:KNE54489.1 hypothetical protein AMAG_00459 [Allomyces macrogynus ATCC 38327]
MTHDQMYPPPLPPSLPPTPHGTVHCSATYDASGMSLPSYDMGPPQPSARMPRTAPHLRDQPPAPLIIADQRLGTAPPAIVPPPRPSQTRVWQLQLGQYELGERTHDLVLMCTNLGGTTPADESSGTWYMNPVDLGRLLCGEENLNPQLIADHRYQSALCLFPNSNTPHLDRAMVRQVAAAGEHHQLHALAQFTATELAQAADANARGVHRVFDRNVGVARTILREMRIMGAPSPFPVPGMLIAPHDSSAADTPVATGLTSPSYGAARLPPPPPPESPLRSPTAPGPSLPQQAMVAAGNQFVGDGSNPASAQRDPSVPALLYVQQPPESTPSAPPPPATASFVPPPPPPLPASAAVAASTTPEAKTGPETGGKRPRGSMSQGSGATPTRGGRTQGGRSRGPSMSEGNPRKRARIEVDENATAMDGVQAVVAATGVSSSTVRRLSVGHAALTVPSEQQREIQRIREEQQSRIAQQNKRTQTVTGAAGSAAAAATSEPTTPAPAEPAAPEEGPADELMEDSSESDSPPPPPPPAKRRGRPKKERPAAVNEASAAPAPAPALTPTLATLLTGPTAEDGDASANTPAPTLPAPRTLSPELLPPPVPAPGIIPELAPPPLPLMPIVSPPGGADAAASPPVIVEPASFGVRYPTAPHLSRPDFLNTSASASSPNLLYSAAPVVIPPLHVADTRQVETAPPPPVRRRISSSRLSATGSSRRHVPPPPPPPVPSAHDVAMNDTTPAHTDGQGSAPPPPPPPAAGIDALRTEFLAVMAAVFDSVTTGSQPVTQHLSPALMAALAPAETALVARIAPLEDRVRAVENSVNEQPTALADRVTAVEGQVRAVDRIAPLEQDLVVLRGTVADLGHSIARIDPLEVRLRAVEDNAASPAALAGLIVPLENRLSAIEKNAVDRAALAGRITPIEKRLEVMEGDLGVHLALAERIALLEKQVHDMKEGGADNVAAAVADHLDPLKAGLAALQVSHADLERTTKDKQTVTANDLKEHQHWAKDRCAALGHRVVTLENTVLNVINRTEALETRHAAPEPRVRAPEGAARDGDHAAASHQGGGARRPAVRYPPGDGEYDAANGQGGGARRAAARAVTPARSSFYGSAAHLSRKDDGSDGPQRRRGGRAE